MSKSVMVYVGHTHTHTHTYIYIYIYMGHNYMKNIWGTELQETHLSGTNDGQPHLGDKNLRVLHILLFRKYLFSFETSVNFCQITYQKTFKTLSQQGPKVLHCRCFVTKYGDIEKKMLQTLRQGHGSER